ncbi:FMN-binding protein [Clostridium fallax]|uniref:FMN-binding domain-containing protein n=1 Tax=Clostridium fallax TaxID=1533 RepID=A0A1M4Z1G8_9CLOT|nr:FMN-binding protein [Clostridium fallax]SHF11901.1 FMN-binding domain-containing protein [Clostridium fallax]SQB22199.1 FMN-binding domain-containing protein [Clostridium fallax]
MKKLASLFVFLMMAITIISCGPSKSVSYKDGTYSAKADSWEYGQEEAIVKIENGKIKDITLKRLDKAGNEVDYNEWKGQEINGKVYPNLNQYRMDMAKNMIDKQTYEVESISGATVSTNNWKTAVQRALDQATVK